MKLTFAHSGEWGKNIICYGPFLYKSTWSKQSCSLNGEMHQWFGANHFGIRRSFIRFNNSVTLFFSFFIQKEIFLCAINLHRQQVDARCRAIVHLLKYKNNFIFLEILNISFYHILACLLSSRILRELCLCMLAPLLNQLFFFKWIVKFCGIFCHCSEQICTKENFTHCFCHLKNYIDIVNNNSVTRWILYET